MPHRLIVSPFLGQHLIVSPGLDSGMRVAPVRYAELSADHAADRHVPAWLSDAAARLWGLPPTSSHPNWG